MRDTLLFSFHCSISNELCILELPEGRFPAKRGSISRTRTNVRRGGQPAETGGTDQTAKNTIFVSFVKKRKSIKSKGKKTFLRIKKNLFGVLGGSL